MIFRGYRNILILYILAIILLTAFGVFVLLKTYFWLVSFWIFLIDVAVVLFFIRFVYKEYKEFSQFLVSIQQDDFSAPRSKSFKDYDLNLAFQRLSEIIIALRDDAQINFQYLQSIINQINTSIICIDDQDEIVLSNRAAQILFKRNVLRNINSLKVPNDDLPEILRKLKTGLKKLVKFNNEGEFINYSIQVEKFKMRDKWYRIFSFQNVQSELEQNELQSWQKLTRVITHEIMNSAIPVSNLSGLVYHQIFDQNGKLKSDLSSDNLEDIKEGLKTIENRSKSLVSFVNATRNFTKIPKPEIEEIIVVELIEQVIGLLKPKLVEAKINIIKEIFDLKLKLLADRSLVEHSLINLILNAIDELKGKDNALIKIESYKNNENRLIISVSDNGKGISESEMDNIFVPFYTTKKNGSGIGLSITKQIMFLHKGSISVKSEKNQGTTFYLSF